MDQAVAEAPTPDVLRGRVFLFMACLLLTVNFADPGQGIINIPVSFFLKNRLHLTAAGLAQFRLLIAVPLIFSFVFGFVRDRWDLFGTGDRGHIVLFGLVTAGVYLCLAFLPPTYAALAIGVVAATASFQVVASAMTGVASLLGQAEAKAGRVSGLLNFALLLPTSAAGLLGGAASQWLEGRNSSEASRALFLGAAALIGLSAVLAVAGPRSVMNRRDARSASASLFSDIRRLVRHRAIYPVLAMQLLWQFSPATGTVLQYHIVDSLHATDAQWGAWNAIFYASFLPVFGLYGLLCRRLPLRTLLWGGFSLAVFQMAPLLLVRSAVGALWAALPMGVIGGVAQAAITDLAIRSCPRGLQGTMMMMFGVSMYYIAMRFGDLFGAEIYDHYGGFVPVVAVTIFIYVLILPIILLVPRELTATPDGSARLT